jgi:anti-sigma28 factor (negative regulator of flagellin synthesis)
MDHRENPSMNDQTIDPDRLKKIESLKQAVADGTYHVPAEDLARKLIEHMLQPKLEPNE